MAPLENDPLYITDEELEARHARLVAEGRMRLGKGPVPPEFFEQARRLKRGQGDIK
jgi:hypothetical protein